MLQAFPWATEKFLDGSSNGARGRQRGGSSAIRLNTCFVWRRWSHASVSSVVPSGEVGTPLGERQTERQRTASRRPRTMGRTLRETPKLERWEPVRRSLSSRLSTWFRPLRQFQISAHLKFESNHEVLDTFCALKSQMPAKQDHHDQKQLAIKRRSVSPRFTLC